MKPVNKLALFLEIPGKAVWPDQEHLSMNQFMINSSKEQLKSHEKLKLEILWIRLQIKVPSYQNNNSIEFFTTLKKEKKKEPKLLLEAKELD